MTNLAIQTFDANESVHNVQLQQRLVVERSLKQTACTISCFGGAIWRWWHIRNIRVLTQIQTESPSNQLRRRLDFLGRRVTSIKERDKEEDERRTILMSLALRRYVILLYRTRYDRVGARVLARTRITRKDQQPWSSQIEKKNASRNDLRNSPTLDSTSSARSAYSDYVSRHCSILTMFRLDEILVRVFRARRLHDTSTNDTSH